MKVKILNFPHKFEDHTNPKSQESAKEIIKQLPYATETREQKFIESL